MPGGIGATGLTSAPHLEVWPESGRVRRYRLHGSRTTVGRGTESDVVIVDGRASRVHAVIERFGTAWAVQDLGSRNGTYVNGRRIAGRTDLTSGDRLDIGRTTLVVRAPDDGTTDVTEPVDPREHDVLVELLRPRLGGGPDAPAASPRRIAERLRLTEDAVEHHLARLVARFAVDGDPKQRRDRLADAVLRRAVGA